MARNTVVDLPAATWVQLTDADVSAASFQNRGGLDIYVAATAGTTAPSDLSGAVLFRPGLGVESGTALADIWPGVSGAARLWAYAPAGGAAWVSHA